MRAYKWYNKTKAIELFWSIEINLVILFHGYSNKKLGLNEWSPPNSMHER